MEVEELDEKDAEKMKQKNYEQAKKNDEKLKKIQWLKIINNSN